MPKLMTVVSLFGRPKTVTPADSFALVQSPLFWGLMALAVVTYSAFDPFEMASAGPAIVVIAIWALSATAYAALQFVLAHVFHSLFGERVLIVLPLLGVVSIFASTSLLYFLNWVWLGLEPITLRQVVMDWPLNFVRVQVFEIVWFYFLVPNEPVYQARLAAVEAEPALTNSQAGAARAQVPASPSLDTAQNTADPDAEDLPRMVIVGGQKICAHAICHLRAQEHELEIVTDEERLLVRARMRDVVMQLGEGWGMQPHRSHWIAAKAVQGVRDEGQKIVILLTDGLEINVARGRMAAFREWSIGKDFPDLNRSKTARFGFSNLRDRVKRK